MATERTKDSPGPPATTLARYLKRAGLALRLRRARSAARSALPWALLLAGILVGLLRVFPQLGPLFELPPLALRTFQERYPSVGVETVVATTGAHAPAHKPGIFTRLVHFLQGSWRELQRVQWPDRRQVIQATSVVIGFVIVAGAFLGAERIADLTSAAGGSLAGATRLVTFAIPAIWLSSQSWFELRHLWYASVATVALQAGVSWWMLTVKLRQKLGDEGSVITAPSPG